MGRKRLPSWLLSMDRNIPDAFLHFDKLILNLLFPMSIKEQAFLCYAEEILYLIGLNSFVHVVREGNEEA